MIVLLFSLVFLTVESACPRHHAAVCFDGYGKVRRCECDSPYLAAEAVYENRVNSTGWAYLEIDTNATLPDEVQAYTAGVLEGHKTKKLIVYFWKNMVEGYCDGAEEYCKRLHDYLEKNLAWLKKQIDYHKTDPYWQQVKLALYQLAGLQDAHNGAQSSRPNMNINVTNLLLFQVNGELEDLEMALNKPKHLRKRLLGSGSCSALIKHDMVSHVSWSTYSSMLRMQKLYRFHFNKKNHAVIFSGYPGTLISIDDFYVTAKKLVVTETTIGNQNGSLWRYVQPTGSVPTWIRTMVANQLATTAMEWTDYFQKFNSGTYNNQWMIVDYKVPFTAKNDRLVVLEQLPGFVAFRDVSDIVSSSDGYWPSYNLPYFPAIYNRSNVWDSYRKYGDFFSYDKCPRAQMFKRNIHEIRDLDGLIHKMRYNNFKRDPLAKCNCTPPYSGENGISARSDLNDKHGKYPFLTLGFRCHGGTDVKAVNSYHVNSMSFVAQMGPTNDIQPTFSWATSPCAAEQKHYGQPISFDFDPVTRKWESGTWDGGLIKQTVEY